ncbi:MULTISPECIES: hypothetical protein [Paenibacillus]|uniref:Uncharacterized protein n=1 Tax=Paenibacillus xylanilyticus TaxID=248903 RepID=A0A7Y6EWZ1_9BACL|nr:hypothetical protein [Paenibacillus xylanilyticus]NUU79837.1 hypothetical protein [Paenibacillus xylanilyticus]
MKKLTIMLGLFLFLIACQDKTNHEDAQKPTEPVSESVTAEETQKKGEGLTSEEDEDIPPVYIDETKYTGDELEIVKLMNTRLRYLWEEDEKGYMSLIDPQSPVSGMSRTKVRKVISMSDITIQEQKKLYEGVVEVTELKENDVESSSIMVFWKKKEDGDSAQWIIADID